MGLSRSKAVAFHPCFSPQQSECPLLAVRSVQPPSVWHPACRDKSIMTMFVGQVYLLWYIRPKTFRQSMNTIPSSNGNRIQTDGFAM